MKVSKPSILFNSKINKKNITRICAITTSGVIGGYVISSEKENTPDKESMLLEQLDNMSSQCIANMRATHMLEREKLIKKIIVEAHKNNETLRLKNISEILKIPIHQVASIIYNSNSNVRDLYNEVKFTRYLRKPVSEKIIKDAADTIKNATGSDYTVSHLQTNAYYVTNFAKQIERSQLNEEERMVFEREFVNSPAFGNELLFTRNKFNRPRMHSIRHPENIRDLFIIHSINPELTEKLCFAYDDDGTFKYNFCSIKNMVLANEVSEELLPIAEEQPKFVGKLLAVKRNDGSKHFGIQEIKKLAEINKKMPRFMSLLLEQKNEQENPRFNAQQIEDIINFYFEEPELVSKKLIFEKVMDKYYRSQRYKFSAECIDKVIKTFKENDNEKIEMLKRMLDEEEDAFISKDYIVRDTLSMAIIDNLNLYDRKKELLNKVNNEITVSKEFQKYFHEQFGEKGLDIIANLARMNLSFKEIQRILYLTETRIDKSDIAEEPWRGNIEIQGVKINIGNYFKHFID